MTRINKRMQEWNEVIEKASALRQQVERCQLKRARLSPRGRAFDARFSSVMIKAMLWIEKMARRGAHEDLHG